MAKSPHPLLEIVPLLRDVAGKLARNLSSALSDTLRQNVQVRPESLELSTRERLRKSAIEPTCCFALGWTANAHPFKGTHGLTGAASHSHASPEQQQRGEHGTLTLPAEAGVMEFSPVLAQAMLDQLMGPSQARLGEAAAPSRRGELTAVDRRVLKAVVEAACEAMGDALSAESDVEIRPAAARGKMVLVAGDPAGVRLALRVVWGGHAETMRVTLVQNVLASALGQGSLAGQSQAEAARGGRAKRTATLVAAIEEQMDAADLANLAQGDLLITETHADGEIILRIDGVPKFAGKLGQYRGRRAVTVTRKLEP